MLKISVAEPHHLDLKTPTQDESFDEAYNIASKNI
jgi:hypothetical protein